MLSSEWLFVSRSWRKLQSILLVTCDIQSAAGSLFQINWRFADLERGWSGWSRMNDSTRGVGGVDVLPLRNHYLAFPLFTDLLSRESHCRFTLLYRKFTGFAKNPFVEVTFYNVWTKVTVNHFALKAHQSYSSLNIQSIKQPINQSTYQPNNQSHIRPAYQSKGYLGLSTLP